VRRALITGATGFTGSHVVPLLLERGYGVRCFVRESSDVGFLSKQQVELFFGDLGNISSLIQAMRDVDVLVNISSLGFGHAPNIIEAAEFSGVKRTLFISTTAIFTSLNAPSKKIRFAAEKAIQGSGLDYTILRPTMIYGSKRDRNMFRLINYLKRFPIVTIFGNGEYLQQPVYVEDVARAVVNALDFDTTIRNAYNIPGAKALTFNRVIDTIGSILKRKVIKFHFPDKFCVKTLKWTEQLGLKLPVKAEQIERLNEHKAFDYEAAKKDFGYSPLNFMDGITQEIESLGYFK
jgi:uncharacterized protein YbjT (DUF2867 family)